MDCFHSLSSDLKSVQAVLDQLHTLAISSRRSKDLALAGLQDEISQVCTMLRHLRTGLEVGRISKTV